MKNYSFFNVVKEEKYANSKKLNFLTSYIVNWMKIHKCAREVLGMYMGDRTGDNV